jgi:hypothetical protein
MFSRWCLLACKSILSTPRCRKMPCTLMKYKMRPLLLEEKKTLLASFSVLYKFVLAIVERIVLTPKSSQEGLDSQWEGCQSSKHKENSGSATARE